LTFREFVSRVNSRYKWYRHCETLADVLERVADGKIKRLMIFLPPRHSKSETVCRLFAAYFLHRYPDRWVGLCSYGAELAFTLSRNARDNYQRVSGELQSNTTAVKHWETGRGGGLWAAGVGGPITGKGWHLGIIDDPIKNAEEAASDTIRSKQKDWYGSTFYTREEPWADEDPHGAMIVIQTRWHEEDLAGYLLSEEAQGDDPERWHIVNLPAIAEKEEERPEFPVTCTVEPDWRKPGEALCPERRPLDKLRKIAERIGDFFFAALFQQRPRPKAGLFFKSEWFGIVPAAPADAERVRYWDTAGADENKGDWTVGLLMARDARGIFYVEDVERGQWMTHPRNQKIKQTAELDEQEYGEVTIYIEQPPGLAKESTDEIVRQLAGFLVYADPVHRDKLGRAEPLKAQCQAGNVKLVKGDWIKRYLAEMTGFPTGKYDDQVDASSGAFNKLVEKRSIKVL